MNRRNILIGTGVVAAVAAGGSLASMAGSLGQRPMAQRQMAAVQTAQAVALSDDDRIIGSEDAPITIIEYASLTCPHCAAFHKDVYPQLKESWIDSGKARMVFRHFPLDALALRASGLTECMQGPAFFGFLDLIFETQQKWARDADPLKALQGLAKQAGLSEEASDACLNDEATLRRILEQRQVASEEYDINSTPSFLVNGEKVSGTMSYEKFDDYLQNLFEESS